MTGGDCQQLTHPALQMLLNGLQMFFRQAQAFVALEPEPDHAAELLFSSIFFLGWYTPARDSRLCRRQSIPCLGFSYFGAGTKEGGGMAALPEMVSMASRKE